MAEELINFDLPVDQSSIIKVIGVGGGGSNAVNHMYCLGIKDVNFVVCNTDAQALARSPVAVKIPLGQSLTEGRGAGNKPDVGRKAAIENIEDVIEVLEKNTKMVFITAGMGGGTGTGAAPVIARAAREMGLLTVGIVTIPFKFEGQQRINQAIDGINEIKEHVDSLVIINNEKLREIYGDLKLSQAFTRADNVLASAAKGIAEIITVPGYINVDFADVQTVLTNSGVAIMGSGVAEGEDRAIKAIQEALNSPLLNNNDIRGAKSILLNVTSGADEISMDEVGEITDYVSKAVAKDTLIIWGTGNDESLGDKVSVTIIAAGFEAASIPELYGRTRQSERVNLIEPVVMGVPKRSEMKFEVKDKSAKTGDTMMTGTVQRTIEFDIAGEMMRPDSFQVKSNPVENSRKAADRVRALKKNMPHYKESSFNLADEKNNIDELESQPAFERRNIRLDDINKHSSESTVSRYTLSEDNDTIRIRANNSYLYDNVD